MKLIDALISILVIVSVGFSCYQESMYQDVEKTNQILNELQRKNDSLKLEYYKIYGEYPVFEN